MNNLDAYQYFCEHESQSIRSVTEDFISSLCFDTDQFNHFCLKFGNLKNGSKSFQKHSDLDTWNSISFCPLPKRPRLCADTTTISFDEKAHPKRYIISHLTIKGLRYWLSSLKSHLDTVAKNEDVSPKTIILTFDDHRTVKIWLVYSHIYECLLQVNTFSLLSSPSLIIATKRRLCVAINSPNQSMFVISMYNTQTLKKYSHSYAQDHADNINDLTKCSRSGMFISIGMDQTVRVWNMSNALVIVLSICFIPTYVCLANENGDILLSKDKQLFVVKTSSYIPNSISQKLNKTKNIECDVLNHKLLIGPLDRLTSVSLQVLMEEKFRFRTKNLFETLSSISEEEKYHNNIVPSRRSGDENFKIVADDNLKIDQFLPKEVEIFPTENAENVLSKQCFSIINSSPYRMNILLDEVMFNQDSKKEIVLSGQPFKYYSSSHFFKNTYSKFYNSQYVPNSNLVSNDTQNISQMSHSEDLKRKNLFLGSDNDSELHNNLEVFIKDSNLNDIKYNEYQDLIEESTKPSTVTVPIPLFKSMVSIPNSSSSTIKVQNNVSIPSAKLSSKLSTKPGTDYPTEDTQPINSNSPQSNIAISIVQTIPSIFDYYSQDKWFKELFPDPKFSPFTKDISGYNCIQRIISACTNIFSTDVIICTLRAILQIGNHLNLSILEKQNCGRLIIEMLLYSQLYNEPLSTEKQYIITILTVLKEYCCQDDNMYVSLLLIEYILGDFEIRSFITEVLEGYGFFDPFHYVSKEFTSWGIPYIHACSKTVLFERTNKWLKHISTSKYYPISHENIITSSYSTNVHKYSYIEALNSFVVLKRREFEKSKDVVYDNRLPTPIQNESYSEHRTVVSLPKFCSSKQVIRFGETLFSQCHTARESTLVDFQKLPRIKLFPDPLSQSLLLQIPVHQQTISLPIDCDRRCQNLPLKKRYFVFSQSYLV